MSGQKHPSAKEGKTAVLGTGVGADVLTTASLTFRERLFRVGIIGAGGRLSHLRFSLVLGRALC